MTRSTCTRIPLLFYLLLVLPFAVPVHAGEDPGPHPFHTFRTVDLDDPHEVFRTIQSRIRNVSIFCASFSEEKELDALSRTITNKGFVIFARDRGLFRAVRDPFDSRQLITKDGLVVEKTPDGTRRKKLESGSAPRQFLDSLYMVFSGNFSEFKDRFRVELKIKKSKGDNNDEDTWILRLHPADEKMKQFFSRMKIQGTGKKLTYFKLHKDNGDITRTTFSNPSYPDELSEKQVERFRSMYKEK